MIMQACCYKSKFRMRGRGTDEDSNLPFSRYLETGCQTNMKISKGAIHKGRPHPRGEGGLVKSGHLRTQGGRGGLWQNADVLKNSNFYQNFRSEVYLVYCVLKDTFDSMTNH